MEETISYDAIIIGSGAGGLTAAVALAQAGKKLLVLEQHDRPGGWTHSFTLSGYRFSPGVHYIGDLHEGGHKSGSSPASVRESRINPTRAVSPKGFHVLRENFYPHRYRS